MSLIGCHCGTSLIGRHRRYKKSVRVCFGSFYATMMKEAESFYASMEADIPKEEDTTSPPGQSLIEQVRSLQKFVDRILLHVTADERQSVCYIMLQDLQNNIRHIVERFA